MATAIIFGKETSIQDDGQIKLIHVLCAYHTKKLRFVEVGANDGVKNDIILSHVKHNEWEGILVEPIKSAYDELCKNYAGLPGVVLENAAIYHDQTVTMYFAENLTAVSSVFRDHAPLQKKKRVKTVVVKAYTLDQLIEKHGFSEFDLLQIDAEGYDFGAIKTLSLNKYQPAIIHYEHRHLLSKDKRDCEKHLMDFGYRLYFNKNNTVATLEL